jgi:paraquat-inducible protein A
VTDGEPLIACHECDALFAQHDIPIGARANCARCGHLLYRNIANSTSKSLALYLSAFVLLIIANVYPFLSMRTSGLEQVGLIYSGGLALYEFGMGELGLVVILTSIIFPLLSVLGMIYLLIPHAFGYLPPFHQQVFQIVKIAEPWSLLSVFMLGTLVAVVKLQSLATVIPGLGLIAFCLMLVVYSAARATFEPEAFWALSSVKQATTKDISPGTSVTNCHTCGLVRPFSEHTHQCARCRSSVHHRNKDSVQRTLAYLFAATMMLIPANVLPIMTVKVLGSGHPDTIISGVIRLIDSGLWGLALIVLVASIVVPAMKLTALGYLLYSVDKGSEWRPRDRTLLYRITHVVGAWSMVDVYLVGLLAGLVKLGLIATIEPGLGATFFCAAVIMTILAANNFDSRLIWDRAFASAPVQSDHTNNNRLRTIL